VKRRIFLGLFVVITSTVTIASALWFSGVLEQGYCSYRGGKWTVVRNHCVIE